jgi:hypothetical protein
MEYNVKLFETECDDQGILRQVGTKMPIGQLLTKAGWKLLAVLPRNEPTKPFFIMQANF